jgi:hypothetical protein
MAVLLTACVSITDISESVDGTITLPGKADAGTKQCLDNVSPLFGVASANLELADEFVPTFDAGYLNKALQELPVAVQNAKAKSSSGDIGIRSFLPAPLKSLEGLSTISQSISIRDASSALEAQRILQRNDAHNQLRGLAEFSAGNTPDGQQSLALDRSALSSYANSVQRAGSSNGFLFAAAGYTYALQAAGWPDIGPRNTTTENKKYFSLYRLLAEASFLDIYLKSYFRNGKIVSVRFDSTDIRKKLVEKIEQQIPPAKPGEEDEREKMIGELADNLLESILGGKPQEDAFYNLIGEIGETSFVTRGGTAYSFPGVTVDVNPLAENRVDSNEIDYTVVGSDIVRVAIEAVGDSWSRLPAAANSTACKHGLLTCLQSGKQNDKLFSDSNTIADKAEAIAGAATGRIIRGISWFSLNNEALAEIIETAVAVSVRKGTEKLAWCHYEKNPAQLANSHILDPVFAGQSSLQLTLDAPRTP